MHDQILWCPSGYIPLCKLPNRTHKWAKDGLTDPALLEVFDSPILMCEILGEPLAKGDFHAAGISVLSGKILTIQAHTWRRPHFNDPHKTNFGYPIEAALAGYEIRVGDAPLQEFCHVVVALADWARFLDLKVIPPEPSERPVDWLERMPSSLKPVFIRTPHAGGAPPKHQWEKFWIEVAKYASTKGLDPKKRIELQKHMEIWTAAEWFEPPDASTIRKRLACL